MKNLTTISRILVGSLFIVSGLIKANDAIGFSFKLHDYFAPDVLNIPFLIDYTYPLAAFICVAEIMLGLSVLVGAKMQLTSWSLLLMIIFFDGLTFYSAYFDKVKDCGCFGDALKLTPWESFSKDVVLLFFSVILFIFRKEITPNKNREDLKYILPSLVLIALFSLGVTGWWFPVIFSIIVYALMFLIKRFDRNEWRLLSLSLIASLIFTIYCYDHLPIKDFRAYKVNANISEGMVVPPDALPAIIEYTWVIEKDGVKTTYVGDYPSIEGGKLVDSSSEIIREAEEPKIHDFMIEGENDDTEFFLSKENVLVVVAYDFEKSSDEGFKRIKKTTDEAIKKGYTVIGMTSETPESRVAKIAQYDLNFEFYFCDAITLKTIVRANPGVFEMDNATIKQKFHWNDIDKLKL